MDFVEWCTIVLRHLTDHVRQSPNAAQFGFTDIEMRLPQPSADLAAQLINSETVGADQR